MSTHEKPPREQDWPPLLTPGQRRPAAALLGLLLLPGLAESGMRLLAWPWRQLLPLVSSTVGEHLIYGLPCPSGTLSWSMPGFPMLAAVIFNHCRITPMAFSVLSWLATVILAGALGRMVSSPTGAWLAVALMLGPAGQSAHHNYPHCAFSLLILLAAGLLVWAAQVPSRARVLAAAAGIGATLLFRSTLAFLPPLLAAWELISTGRGAPKVDRYRQQRALIWLLVPFLFVIPWMRMNWVIHRVVYPFEYGEANSNIVTGALGLTQTVEGDWAALLGEALPDRNRPGSVLLWAAKHVLQHPADYLVAFIQRLYFAFQLHPVLFLLAGIAAWLLRARRDAPRLALLCAYLLLAHCLMSVQEDYFAPLWPLLAVLGAAGIARLWGAHGPMTPRPALLFNAGLAATLVFCVFITWRVWDYRPPETMREDLLRLDLALSRRPQDAWLWSQRGRHLLLEQDAPAAVEAMARAHALWPQNPDIRKELAWARALAGDPRALLREEASWDSRLKLAAVSLMSGRRRQARAHLTAARGGSRAIAAVREGATKKGAQVGRTLAASDHALVNELALVARQLPPAHALSFLREAQETLGIEADEHLSRVAYRFQSAGRYDETCRILDSLMAGRPAAPWRAKLHSDRGVALFLAGDLAQAQDAFRLARAADPGNLSAYLSAAAAYERMGQRSQAAALLQTAPRPQGRDDPLQRRLWGEIESYRKTLATAPAP